MIIVRLRDLREDADKTQQDIANVLHISQRAYSHYENGTRSLPIELLIALSKYYKVSTDYILNLTDIKKNS